MDDKTDPSASVATPTAPPQVVPAGWYDDGSGRLRWFDGSQWLDIFAPEPAVPAAPAAEPVAIVAAEATAATAVMSTEPAVESVTADNATARIYQAGEIANGHQLTAQSDGTLQWMPLAAAATSAAPGTPARKSRRGLAITLGAVGGVLLLFIIIGTLNRPKVDNVSPVADTSTVKEADDEAEAEPEPEMVAVPTGLVGMAAADAVAALEAVGLDATYDGEPTAKVLSYSPTSAKVEVGSTVRLTVEQPPALTLSQRNAIGSAESYLDFTNFSRTGLIGQLEYEGFSTEDATFAVDNVTVDWNAQAAGTAQSYLEYSSFSREGLYDQLAYEGFTAEQIEFALAAVGY